MDSEHLRGNAHARVLQLLAAMMGGTTFTRHSAAEHVAVNHEGAYRMLESLEEHVPGVRRRPDARPAVFEFDAESAWATSAPAKQSVARALAVSFGAAFSRVFAGTPYEQELRVARSEILEGLTSKYRRYLQDIDRKIHVISGSGDVLPDNAQRLTSAIEAILRERVVKVRYQRFSGTEETFEVRLYSLMVYRGQLYVVGSGAETRFHPYRLARIRSLEPTLKNFDYPPRSEYDPSIVFRHSFGVFVDPEPCKIAVRLSAAWRTFAAHHRWHESQTIEPQADGTVIVYLHARPCSEVEQWVLQFGEDAEVIEPASLRESIAERLRKAAARYS